MQVLMRIQVHGLADFVADALIPYGHRLVHVSPVDNSTDSEHHNGDIAIVDAHALDTAATERVLNLPCTAAELVSQIHALGRLRVAARQFAAACVAARLPHARLAALTVREVDVLRLVAKGNTDQEIASLLHISSRTARFHVGSILRKSLTRNRAHAAAFGVLFELLQVESADIA